MSRKRSKKSSKPFASENFVDAELVNEPPKTSQEKSMSQDTASSEKSTKKPETNTTNNPYQSESRLPQIALVLSAIALAATGYLWYQVKVSGEQVSGEQQAKVVALGERFSGINDAQQSLTQQVDEVKAQLFETQQTVGKQVNELQQSTGLQLNEMSSKVLDSRGKLDGLLADAQQNLSEYLTTAQTKADQQGEAFRQQTSELSESIQQLKSQLESEQYTLTLKEVKQLVSLADERLRLTGNNELAASALQLVDERVKTQTGNAFIDLRQAIAGDLNTLQSVQAVDVSGIALRIDALNSAIDSWMLRADKRERMQASDSVVNNTPTEQGEDQKPQSRTDKVLSLGKDFLSDLGGMIKIRNVEQTQTPALAPEQAYFVTENLRLMLRAAQVALLESRQDVFSQNLTSAGEWTSAHFDTDSADVQNALNELGSLAKIDIAPEAADISATTSALEALLKN